MNVAFFDSDRFIDSIRFDSTRIHSEEEAAMEWMEVVEGRSEERMSVGRGKQNVTWK